jgi:2-polyprenyl-3-methyl-5-hydroxy-6-metoxy-1,4-benzoquinol methylase
MQEKGLVNFFDRLRVFHYASRLKKQFHEPGNTWRLLSNVKKGQLKRRNTRMSRSRIVRQLLLISCLLMIAFSVSAQTQPAGSEYEPVLYQAGKDVVWVPTPQALADKMLDLAKVTSQDYVIDLGSGDGRLVITAAKRGARSLGIEYNPDLVALSRRNAAKEGVSDKSQFIQADLFESDFSQATVITMFLLPDINLKLRPKILNLKPGTRIVSNSFNMAEWKADQTVGVKPQEGCDNNFCDAYFWIVPAKVEGAWKFPQGELTLSQQFQMISGKYQSGGNATQITDGKLNGDQISFTVGDEQYTGRVSGNTMQGTFKSGENTANWSATRTADIALH